VPARILKLFITSTTLLMVQSCSNTIIGQDLSDSFDSPVQNNVSQEKSLKNNNSLSQSKVKQDLNRNSSSGSNLVDRKIKKTSNSIINSKNQQFKRQKKSSNFIPQPYRITIKLSAANPSAPAERVTKALRTAGVTFEVEKIEIISDQFSVKNSQSGIFKR